MTENIVVIGGGNGLSTIVGHLRNISNVTAICTTFDDGGDTGVLREQYNLIGLGDIRRVIQALSDKTLPWVHHGGMNFELNGRGKIGNNLLASYILSTKDIMHGINIVCRLMGVRGRVYPISLSTSRLCANFVDGTSMEGETNIDRRHHTDLREIKDVYLNPKVHIFSHAYDAIIRADKIIFAPGDPYTSILPNTLVEGFKEAIRNRRGRLGMILNLVTKHAESPQWPGSKFISTLLPYIGIDKLDFAICNGDPVKTIIRDWRRLQMTPVEIDENNMSKMVDKVIIGNLGETQMQKDSYVIRHNENIAFAIANA